VPEPKSGRDSVIPAKELGVYLNQGVASEVGTGSINYVQRLMYDLR